MALALLFLLLGIVSLYYGADWFVGGASSLARGLRISAAVVGLTVVSFASSTPELIATLTAALKGSADVGLGNILGSNVANIGLVLGLSATLRPMPVSSSTVRSGLPWVLGAMGLLYLQSIDGMLGRGDGLLLVGLFVVFSALQIRDARAHQSRTAHEAAPPLQLQRDGVRVVGGLAGMVLGAYLLIDGATTLAAALGLSEAFIAASIVALGTSLPELATSVVAAFKGEADIAVGNVLGSNVLNILLVLGLVLIVQPLSVGAELWRLHYPAMLGFSLALLPTLLLAKQIPRPLSMLLLLGYAGYIGLAYRLGVVAP